MATPTNPPRQPVVTITPMQVATAALVALYVNANAAILDGFARIVREMGVTALGTVVLRSKANRLSRAIAADLGAKTPPLLDTIFRQARTEAAVHAYRAFGSDGGGGTVITAMQTADGSYLTHAEGSVAAIQADLAGKLAETREHILRSADDLYRDVVAEVGKQLVGDTGTTPKQAQAEAFARFVEQGITGYVRRDGARLPIESYTEMAVRTAGMRAYNAEYEARLNSLGVHYFTVPNDGHPCPACWPWQGRVLTDGLPDEHASATIAEARAAGLFHPQCRHVLIPFFPGHSKRPTPSPEWSVEQQAAYNATQRLRALERRVRAQKDVRDHAATAEVKQAAARRVRATQAAIREHVETHALVRRSHREQPRLGLAPKTT